MLYVEMGAFDGVVESNTRFFDECLGWEGVLIEANPSVYTRLVQNRPHTHRVSFAPSCNLVQEAQNKTIDFHVSTFTSAAQSDIVEENRNLGSVPVPCGSLTPVLLDLVVNNNNNNNNNNNTGQKGKRTIQFFSLDVEGAEYMVLQQLNLKEIVVEIFIIESHNSHCREHCPTRDKVRQLMADHGYERHEGMIRRSDLYIHPTLQKKDLTSTSSTS